MRQQAIFFDERTATKRVQVLKVYDVSFARECFNEMNEDALSHLSESLEIDGKYELDDTGDKPTWEDLEDEAREDGNLLSFFVVLEESNGQSKLLYVSPDWPSAETFAKRSLV